MRVGITGHSNLTPDSVPLVAAELRKVLSEFGERLVGLSCLARGADQVFARVVLELGGELHVVLPAADYRERKVKPDNREEFEALIRQAVDVHVLPFETSNRDAYAAANEALLADVDTLVAVWDGAPPDGKGGTGDTVEVARERGIPVTVVWPDGAARR
jgi:argininosuccinate synthase